MMISMRQAIQLLATALLLTATVPSYAADQASAPPKSLQFNRDVRPILADKCLACHGPDANKREANLRLDLRDSALSDRKGVHAIVPGDTTQSELVRRISSSDPAYRMPP